MKKQWFLLFAVGFLAGCATGGDHSSIGGEAKNLDSKTRFSNLIGLAQASVAERDPVSALQYLRKAEKIQSDSSALHYTRALAYYFRGEKTLALRSAELAASYAPKAPGIQNMLGKVHLDLGHYRKAELALQRAAANPAYRERFKAYTTLGILKYKKRLYRSAKIYLDRAVQDNPNSACAAYYYRGHIAMKDRKYGHAAQDYERATQNFCGGFKDAHYAHGVALAKSERFREARKKFLEVSKLFPKTKVAEKSLKRLGTLP